MVKRSNVGLVPEKIDGCPRYQKEQAVVPAKRASETLRKGSRETSASEGDSIEIICGKERENHRNEIMSLKGRLLSWFSDRVGFCPRYQGDQVVGPLPGGSGTTSVMHLSFCKGR
jgi:hypothetical protein